MEKYRNPRASEGESIYNQYFSLKLIPPAICLYFISGMSVLTKTYTCIMYKLKTHSISQVNIWRQVYFNKKENLILIKRKFKQWWSTIPPISTKWPITSHHSSSNIKKKTSTYNVGNPSPGLWQAQKYGGVKPVNGTPILASW